MPMDDPVGLSLHDEETRLLFVTSELALTQLGALGGHLEADLNPHQVIVLPADLGDDHVERANSAAEYVRERVINAADVDGVVIIGGYDSVPPQFCDTLEPTLRPAAEELMGFGGGKTDLDCYFVWNDDHLAVLSPSESGATTMRGPELPVSRVPCWDSDGAADAACAALVRRCLETPGAVPSSSPTAVAARFKDFPFGDWVYNSLGSLPSNAPMHVSPPPDPDAPGQLSYLDVQAQHLYLALHGEARNATYAYGVEELRTIDLADWGAPAPGDASRVGGVVFTCCCWGALISTESAHTAPATSATFVARAPNDSLAISLLAHGADAVVGFTGSHHGAINTAFDNFNFHGAPLHRFFWENILAERRPAESLFRARLQYLKESPFRGPADPEDFDPAADPYSRAVEAKTFWSTICLGVGW